MEFLSGRGKDCAASEVQMVFLVLDTVGCCVGLGDRRLHGGDLGMGGELRKLGNG